MALHGLVCESQAPKRISRIDFGVLSSADVTRLSHMSVTSGDFYDPTKRTPVPMGPLDRRLGVSDKSSVCETCMKTVADCVGHFGHMKLALPVFHIGYIREIVVTLQMICKNCSRVMLTDDEREVFTRRMRAVKMDRLKRAAILKTIHERCKKKSICPKCHAANGIVKKLAGIFRIVHDKFRNKSSSRMEDQLAPIFSNATAYNPDIQQHVYKYVQDLNPIIVFQLFSNIPTCDLDVLDMPLGRPEDLILCNMLVPPVCIRPSVPMGSSGSNEDDLTVKIGDIARINNMIRSAIEKNGQTTTLMELWDFLQQQCAMYINSDMPGFPASAKNSGGKPVRALSQRLKGKQGRFRGNLSGKRVDYSARTVISPDPNLSIEQVGVPVLVAKILTVPERVTSHNLQLMKKLVRNGPSVWPGANFVEMNDGSKRFLKYTNRNQVAAELQIGTLIERHLLDGDPVLFNRQPSLHRLSILCHTVCVKPWRTFRFNTCVCTPYNADFDGDEMNLHVPQTLEARAEALTLMAVKENLVTPKNGEVLIALNQDFVTGCYLLSNKDVFYDRVQFMFLCGYIGDSNEQIELPPPAVLKPMMLWTGKQIFEVVWSPNKSKVWPQINFELKARNYERDDVMCPRDGYILIQNSQLMCGNLCKSCMGGSKNGLFYVLLRDHSPDAAVRVMNRTVKLVSRWLKDFGFSFGIDDVTPSVRLSALKETLVSSGYKVCAEHISQFEQGKLEARSGCTEEETLEATLLGQLSNIRGDAGTACLNELPYRTNSPLIMAVCGSKGSKINISQMIACVGQQAVNGHRIPNGFGDRSLPHFEHGARTPAAKGFVQNSFYTGLTATEFFFHTMGGREGLVDTAVKTAETGYMQRRLMKALEDLSAQYDHTVRNSENTVVQFTYGDDGLDPIVMEEKGGPADFARILSHVRATFPCLSEEALTPTQMQKRWIDQSNYLLRDSSNSFKELVLAFLTKFTSTMVLDEAYYYKCCATDVNRITASQFDHFLEMCCSKFVKAKIAPGTAVGAIGAQSIGEPGTQMTLKTFHFAGVASMNVTLGVPRIKEIINAAKAISTPIITAYLECDNDIKAARIVKARIEKSTLGEVCSAIYEVYTSQTCYIAVKLDLERIQDLHLEVNIETIRDSILASKLKIKDRNILTKGDNELRIFPPDNKREKVLPLINSLKIALPHVVIKGLKTVARVVISDIGKGRTKYQLLVEGADLRGVMGITGVRGAETTCNHVMEVEKRLGVEAARVTIVKEIQNTMEGHGLSVDYRHLMLLADVMTFQGEVLGITRFGISKMKQSVLMLASFEKTVDHLFSAAVHGLSDAIIGVSESIIMGAPMPVGTNMFKLIQKIERQPIPPSRSLLLTGKYKHNLKL